MSKFLVAGFVQVETIVKVKELPAPYKQFSSIPDSIYTNMGGAGYDEAVALTWLGNEVDFMSMTDKKMEKDKRKTMLQANGVQLDCQYVLPRLENMPTAVVLYADKGKMQTFEDVKDIRTVEYDAALFERQIQDKDMVLISNCNFCRPLLSLAKKYNKPLAVNIRSMTTEKTMQKEDFLEAADIFYISDDDLDKEPYECINECRERFDPKVIVMGVGAKGAILYMKEDNSIVEYKPVKTNEIVNTLGAGNAMFSAFLHYYVKTGDAREAIKNALLFASYKIGFVGTSNGFMTEEQIEQWKRLIWKK